MVCRTETGNEIKIHPLFPSLWFFLQISFSLRQFFWSHVCTSSVYLCLLSIPLFFPSCFLNAIYLSFFWSVCGSSGKVLMVIQRYKLLWLCAGSDKHSRKFSLEGSSRLYCGPASLPSPSAKHQTFPTTCPQPQDHLLSSTPRPPRLCTPYLLAALLFFFLLSFPLLFDSPLFSPQSLLLPS